MDDIEARMAIMNDIEHFTVLIPNFNKAPYLKDCILSLLNQSTADWRCVIVDDGSTDTSEQFFQTSRLLQDPRFEVHYNEKNLGNAKTLSKLIELAPTDIVGILDSDDALEPDCIEKVLAAYRESYKGFVYTNFRYCDAVLKRGAMGYCAKLPAGKSALENDCVSAFRTFRVSEYRKTDGVDERLTSAIDKEMIYRLEEVTELHFIDEPLYLYRRLPNSLSGGRANRRIAKQNHGRIKAAAKLRREKMKTATPIKNSSPNIHTVIAYAEGDDQNLGQAYNQVFEMMDDNDWVCFLDHDAMFTTSTWHKQLVDIVIKHPDVGMFTTMTNRVNNKVQLYGGRRSDNHDVRVHRTIGQQLQNQLYDQILELPRAQAISGVVMMMRKSTWQQAKFKSGFLGVDNQMHYDVLALGLKVALMRGVYVYHWYRGDGSKSHLPANRKKAIKPTTMKETAAPSAKPIVKKPEIEMNRTSIINHLIKKNGYSTYLEIGVRNPRENFNKINCATKDSVDPEVKAKAMYTMTSDAFFKKQGREKQYDIIFIDGMHEEKQVMKDISNSLKRLKKGGVIVMHDCNPPTEWHARSYDAYLKERGHWNGTTYRAFVNYRCAEENLEMYVVDTDWGIGIIRDGTQETYPNKVTNFDDFENDRKEILQLVSTQEFLNRETSS